MKVQLGKKDSLNSFRKASFFQYKQNISALLFCVAGVGVNMLLSAVVSAFELPLYLDTVGSVIVAVTGGYLPGVLVGFVTNIIKSIMAPSSLYYGVLNVLIALVAAWFARHGWLKKLTGIFAMIIVFTLIGGGIGALIPLFMDGLTFDSESLSGVLYATGYFNSVVSHLFSSIIMDLPDKAITVVLALAIVHYIPDKYRSCFSLKAWMQTPVSDEEAAMADRMTVRGVSLKIKMHK